MPTNHDNTSCPPTPSKIPGVAPALGYYTLRELAQVMGRNITTIWRWRDRSQNPLPARKLGRLPVVFIKDLEAWLERESAGSANDEVWDAR